MCRRRRTFQRSIRVTFSAGTDDQGRPCGDGTMLFIQSRGVTGLGAGLSGIFLGFPLPATARLQLQVRANITYKPLDYMALADLGAGAGAVFGTSLSWHSTSRSTIEV